MAIKVFVKPITSVQYVGDPPSQFVVNLPLLIAQSTALEVNGFEVSLAIPIGTTPAAVYQLAYDALLQFCADNGMETPTKADVYGYVPMDFSMLLP